MQKLKSIIFVAGLMLLILAAVVGYLSWNCQEKCSRKTHKIEAR